MKSTLEKSTCSSREHRIVIVCATMSTGLTLVP